MPTQIIDYAGYSGCIALTNERVRVVLGPHCGGRVLEYALDGTNVLWLDPAQNGYVYDPQGPPPALLSPCGGRFDIGPEMIIPPHPELWLGRWSAEIVDDHTARMTSVESPSVGVQLVREFSLAPDSTRLSYMQTIINVSEGQTRWCHWSRTFGRGHGIAVVPLTPELSKYPRQYVMYGPGRAIQVAPEDPAIRVQDGYLQVFDTPAYPKLGIDSHAGWFAYLTSDGLLFVRRWPTDPEQVYNELAGLTLSLWYFRDVVELEPIGPMQVLAPGESAALTEEWWLTAHPFPEQRDSLDLARVAEAAQALMDS
jgi:hypothetical protein